jgi:formimidoylglutamate deiminase
MPNAMQQGLTWSIGTDSHVNRAWTTELLGLEYSQRLLHQQRNVAASASVHPSSAAVLFECALNGGSAASGLPLGGICKGQRADFQSFDTRHHALLGIPAMHLLDALVFSSPHALPSQVGVAGRLITPLDSASAWTRTMQALWI